jgi:hypothetical protein
MSDFLRLKSMGVSMAALLCMLTLVGCPPAVTPSITAVDPTEVPATIATEVTVTGQNFGAGATVIVSDVNGDFATQPTVVAAGGTSLTFVSPTVVIEEDKPAQIRVRNTSGRESSRVDITFKAPPDLTGIFPMQVPAQVPTQIALSGRNLEPGAEVCFISNVGSFGCDTLTAGLTVRTAALPNTVGPSLVAIRITNPDGQTDTLAGALLYQAAPSVLTVQPDLVPATIPTQIRIFGTGFDNGAVVEFRDSGGNVVGREFFELVNSQGATNILVGSSPVVRGLDDDECLTVTVTFATGAFTEPVVKALGTLCVAAPPQIASASPENVPAATTETEVSLVGPNLREGSSVIAMAPAGTGLTFGNGLSGRYGLGREVTIPASEVEFDDLVAGGQLTFVRPAIEDNPLTLAFEGVRFNTGVRFAVVDEWGQVSDDTAVVGYNTSPRILGFSPLVVPSTVPVTFLATANNLSLDATGAGDLSFYFFDRTTGDVLAHLGDPSVELWEQLIDPSVNADPEMPTTAVRGVTPTVGGVLPVATFQNVAVVMTNADGQRAIYPITYSAGAEILSVRNVETGFAEVGATASVAPGGNFPSHFPVGRTVRIEGFDFNSTNLALGDWVEVRFSLGAADPDANLDQDGTLLDIVQGMVQRDVDLGVQYILVEAPALPCGTLAEDTIVQVRVQKADGQGTSESAVGALVYKAEPMLVAVRTIPNGDAVHTEGEFPSTVPTIFEIEGDGLASAQYLGLPRPQVEFRSSLSSPGQHLATVPFTTGQLNTGNTPLVGVQVVSDLDPTASDVVRGRTPAILGLTAEEDVTVILYDAYGQSSICLTDAGPIGGLTLAALPPPGITGFSGVFVDCEGIEVTVPNLAPGTDQVAASFEIQGVQLGEGMSVELFRNSVFSNGAWQPVGTPFATVGPDDLVNNGVNLITGDLPALLGPGEDTALNVTAVLVAQDGQRSVAFPGIKLLGAPQVERVIVSGTDDPGTGDLGDSFFVTNGPFRNTFGGPNSVTFEIIGRNLDCRSPVTGAAELIDLSLSAGATTAAETSLGPVLGNTQVAGNVASGTMDVTEATITFGIVDLNDTFSFNSAANMAAMTDGYGYVDIDELCLCGQTVSADDVLLTVQGPATVGEGNAIALAVGDMTNNGTSDIATLVASAAAYYGYTSARVNVWFGVDGDTIPIEPNYTLDLGADLPAPFTGQLAGVLTANARNMVVADINGDGIGDLIVGLPDLDLSDTSLPVLGGGTAGVVAVLTGTGTGFDAPVYIAGELADDGFGATVAAGDIDGDGIDDLVVGAPNAGGGAGRVYVYLGDAAFAPVAADLTIEAPTPAAGDHFGLGLAVGDYDDDGLADIFVGAPGANADAGAVFQYAGAATPSDVVVAQFDGTAGAQAGYPVLGDFDGDGVADLHIGSPGLEEVLVFAGADASPDAEEHLLVLQDELGAALAAGTGSGFAAGIAAVNGGGTLVSGPEFAGGLLNGIVQLFEATSDMPEPSILMVGVDTSEDYLSIVSPGLYGQQIATGNVLQATEGEVEYLITLPGLGGGGGLVIVSGGQ